MIGLFAFVFVWKSEAETRRQGLESQTRGVSVRARRNITSWTCDGAKNVADKPDQCHEIWGSCLLFDMSCGQPGVSRWSQGWWVSELPQRDSHRYRGVVYFMCWSVKPMCGLWKHSQNKEEGLYHPVKIGTCPVNRTCMWERSNSRMPISSNAQERTDLIDMWPRISCNEVEPSDQLIFSLSADAQIWWKYYMLLRKKFPRGGWSSSEHTKQQSNGFTDCWINGGVGWDRTNFGTLATIAQFLF